MGEKRSINDDAFDSPTFDKDGSFHVDKPVGSMSISPCGRDVVLASRQGLHIIDLDSPWTPPRHLSHLTPWEVADVQWSPFASRDYWVASTSNQKALVWNLAMSTPSASIEHVLHAHTRAITDINFSAHHPDLLATCGIDSFVHCWDLRFPARPAISFCDWFAGATQVKWNRQDGHIIASSHDKVLRIWDDRKGAHPLRSITAHRTKIYGIDWNRTEGRKLVTCSLDKTIKFWDYEDQSNGPERTLTTDFPVWRARHTPFGRGLLAMPQRDDFNVHLFDRRLDDVDAPDQPLKCVKEFTGHENHVKEFLWRARGSVDFESDEREWQLVTWGSDYSLRLHRMTDADLGLVGFKRGDPSNTKLHFTRRNATYKTFREDPENLLSPQYHTTGHTGKLPYDREAIFNFNRTPVQSSGPSLSSALGGWMSGGFVNPRFNTETGSTARKDLDPITWMKGVKIGKREPPTEQSLPSIASPNFRANKAADDFESLGDEITHVGTKFSRVEFNRVDVQKRFVQLSLHGPWGPKHTMAFLNCRVEFPADYPQFAYPHVTIEKTAALPDETITRLQTDSKQLGHAFQSSQKPSFEALVRYLQGEQTVEDLTAWAKEDPDTSVFEFAAGSEASSSDDEDDLGAFVGKQEDGTGMTGSGVLSVSNANVNVPLARTCGALWSHDGRLICFFSHKDDISQSLLGSLRFENPSSFPRSRRRGFQALKRVYPPSSTIKSKGSSIATVDSDESDSDYSSDSSDLSSSSSWLSNHDNGSKGQYHGAQAPLRPSISPFQGHEKLADEARRSNASLSGTKSRNGSSKSFVSLHQLSGLLPSKPILAERYSTTMPHACITNAQAAREHGYASLADAWLVIDMILKDTVPLKAIPLPDQLKGPTLQPSDILVGLDTAFAEHADLKATVKWGNHPFGKNFLVAQLFDYFARLGDIQMLAVMSCIFCMPAESNEAANGGALASGNGNHRHTLMEVLSSPTVKSPNRVDYFPSIEVAVSVLHPDQAKLIEQSGDKPRIESTSQSSSLGAPSSELHSFPTAITPPVAKFPRRSSDHAETEAVPISTSPDRVRWAHRSSSQLASAFSSSLQRQFFSASASSSPPGAFPRKAISPMSSFGAHQISAQSLLPSRANTRSFSIQEETRFREKNSFTPRSGQTDSVRLPKVPRFHVCLKNQDQFPNDGYSDVSLLKLNDEWRYEKWRSSYADLLTAWRLPLQRAEVMKHSSASLSSRKKDASAAQQQDLLSIGKRKATSDMDPGEAENVQILPFCTVCGPKQPGGGGMMRKCIHQQRRLSLTLCILCEEIIHGRARPCLECGHAMHAACWERMVGLCNSSPYVCISGCGCHCAEHAQVAGHRVEATVHQGSPAPSVIRDSSDLPKKSANEQAVPWEDVAYESLVKNLGGFQQGKSTWRSKTRTYSSHGN